jgi:glycosyltransferase involved in cell wall biosynthesis
MISVIIPVYKKSIGLIDRCFQSVLNQTYKDVEVLVYYDWYSDESFEYIKQICKENNFKLNYSLIPRSSYLTRILGIKESLGDFLSYVDSDDWIDKTFLEDLLLDIKDNNFIICKEKVTSLTNQTYIEESNNRSFNFFINEKEKYFYLRGLFSSKYLKGLNNLYQGFLPYHEDKYLSFFTMLNKSKITFATKNSYYNYILTNESVSILLNKGLIEIFKRLYSSLIVFNNLKSYKNSQVENWKNYDISLIQYYYPLLNSITDFEKKQVSKLLKNFELNDKISKVIHYVWIGDFIPSHLQKCVDSWGKQDYGIIRWDEKQFQAHPWVKSCLEHKKFALASDFIRLWILYNFGGIYFDTDNMMLKPLDDSFLDTDFLIGYENDDLILGFNVIGCKVGSPFIKLLLDWYKDKVYEPSMENFPVTIEGVKIGGALTINKIGTQLLKQFIKSGEIKPYNNEYFIAGHYMPNTPYSITDNTYIQHQYKANRAFTLADFSFKS